MSNLEMATNMEADNFGQSYWEASARFSARLDRQRFAAQMGVLEQWESCVWNLPDETKAVGHVFGNNGKCENCGE